jgi:hypothetical protein
VASSKSIGVQEFVVSESAGAPAIDLVSALSASVEAANQSRQRARKPAAASWDAPAKGGDAKAGPGDGAEWERPVSVVCCGP